MADQALSPILLSLISPANSVNPLPKSSSTASSALHGRHCQIPLSPIENPPPCFLLLSLLRPRRARPNGTVNRCLLRLFDIKSAANPVKPIHGVVSFDVIVDSSRNLSIRVFTPSSNAISLPILIFFHGGGFSFLSNASFSYVTLYRCFARRIPAVVLSVNYRLSPEHRFPSQYDYGFDVLQFLDHENNTIGLLAPTADLSKCFLAGDSAGANLAHHVAVRFSRQKSQFQRANIIGLVSIQPFFGGQERTQSEIQLNPGYTISVARTDCLWRAFLPEGSDRDHSASNVSRAKAEEISELGNFPATVVFVGGFDPLKDWQRKYYEWLKKSGKKVDLIEYPKMIHAFYLFPELPHCALLINQLTDFVSKCTLK